MKQLEKLGSQGSRMLTEEQMKDVKGGTRSSGCLIPGSNMQCHGELCLTEDLLGNSVMGRCTSSCECDTRWPISNS